MTHQRPAYKLIENELTSSYIVGIAKLRGYLPKNIRILNSPELLNYSSNALINYLEASISYYTNYYNCRNFNKWVITNKVLHAPYLLARKVKVTECVCNTLESSLEYICSRNLRITENNCTVKRSKRVVVRCTKNLTDIRYRVMAILTIDRSSVHGKECALKMIDESLQLCSQMKLLPNGFILSIWRRKLNFVLLMIKNIIEKEPVKDLTK